MPHVHRRQHSLILAGPPLTLGGTAPLCFTDQRSASCAHKGCEDLTAGLSYQPGTRQRGPGGEQARAEVGPATLPPPGGPVPSSQLEGSTKAGVTGPFLQLGPQHRVPAVRTGNVGGGCVIGPGH